MKKILSLVLAFVILTSTLALTSCNIESLFGNVLNKPTDDVRRTVSEMEWLLNFNAKNYEFTVQTNMTEFDIISYRITKNAVCISVDDQIFNFAVEKDGAWYDLTEKDGAYVGIERPAYDSLYLTDAIMMDANYSEFTFDEEKGAYALYDEDDDSSTKILVYFENAVLVKIEIINYMKGTQETNFVYYIFSNIGTTVVEIPEFTVFGDEDPIPDPDPDPNPNPNPTNEYFLGMGVVFGDHTASETNATVASVVLDANGRIVACRLDVAQNKYTFDIDYETFSITNLLSKMELGDDYGMAAAINYGMDWNGDGIVKEWYDQAKAFEAHVVGMTAEEVAAMGEAEVPGKDYIISTDEDLLAAGCTIQINDFKAAVVKACNDEQGVHFSTDKEFTLGLAVNSMDNGSVFFGFDEIAVKIQLNVDFATSVVADGIILASLNDGYQPIVSIDWEGEVVSANVGKNDGNYNDLGLMTKRELKEYYLMSKYGASMDRNGDGKVLEWYLQSAAFSAYVVGMTGNEVAMMKTQFVNNYNISADEELLCAGCTIQITELIAVVAESVGNAR